MSAVELPPELFIFPSRISVSAAIGDSTKESSASASAKVLTDGKDSSGAAIFDSAGFKSSVANSEDCFFGFKNAIVLSTPEASQFEKAGRSFEKSFQLSEKIAACLPSGDPPKGEYFPILTPATNPNETTKVITANPEVKKNLTLGQFDNAFGAPIHSESVCNRAASFNLICSLAASRIFDFSSDSSLREGSSIS